MFHESILVIDDDHEMLDLLDKKILTGPRFTFISATDGQSGIDIAIQTNPDLIIIDLNLPKMNGLEVLAKLRQSQCHSPAILMNSIASESIAIKAFRLGVRDYITKPFTEDEIQQTINRALRETRLAREQEILNRNLLTAETVRVTVITISHYLNNYLTTLKGGLTLLRESLDLRLPDSDLLVMMNASQRSVLSIQALMKVLLETTNVRITDYTSTTPIINIEDALRDELNKMPEYKDME